MQADAASSPLSAPAPDARRHDDAQRRRHRAQLRAQRHARHAGQVQVGDPGVEALRREQVAGAGVALHRDTLAVLDPVGAEARLRAHGVLP
ncbi:hypothetical protein HHL21_02010 [Massilia sp. RP-1-19]|uniref:Uncharacterized protein n=1 Tax=Massilia polaris TaxID=2728846 RepID=A0A848HEJ9_9BURK|nr:hypothetical protein [Massilia polaris]NML59875.1 hypothetical protein [Massilia polaris]